ncbi:hypothetical protein IHQ68_17965 [Chelatococcus sambhunathii]|uniref:Uncharacterized protein n=1 Tax=Chelatococcus sambhunathii TaxID=363953 RepID=A0ABU1DKL9_9HYPH|nr:hypothetical protein [Chelatococcus sambhunathii]MDR4308509.1 hypothetical protein [Chelatococcus sambhunathii]
MKILLATLALFLAATAAQGAELKAPEGLSVARKALAEAVEKKDVKAFSAMSRFPLVIDVYQMAPKIAAKRFGKADIDLMFGGGDEGVLKCLRGGAVAKNDPKADDTARRFGVSWYADCDGNNYFFAEKDGRWSFIGYQNVNE